MRPTTRLRSIQWAALRRSPILQIVVQFGVLRYAHAGLQVLGVSGDYASAHTLKSKTENHSKTSLAAQCVPK
jgi:hypothetical protein